MKLRSILAFSGANKSLRGEYNPKIHSDNGILTLLEMNEMNLTSTELITFSACQTGLGNSDIRDEFSGMRLLFSENGEYPQRKSGCVVCSNLWKPQKGDGKVNEIIRKNYLTYCVGQFFK